MTFNRLVVLMRERDALIDKIAPAGYSMRHDPRLGRVQDIDVAIARHAAEHGVTELSVLRALRERIAA